VTVRILLADDHPMFREGLRFTLDREPDLAVVAEAADGLEAVRLAAELTPDLVVMDIAMPHLDGLSATRRLREQGVTARVLVLTMSEDDESVFAALRAGAGGYLVKGADPEQVLSAVRAVAGGHAVLGSHLAARMLSFFSVAAPPDPLPELSPREREVLTLVAEGLTNQEIGRALFISPITVRNHVSSILTKLGLRNRADVAAHLGRQMGQLPDANRPGGPA
jgi:DNA-binding NarL/FixJ family response regulator